MARLPRLTLADHPHHIILRGNNRQAIFMDSADHQRMLSLLQVHATGQGVQVHAYVLMGNHLHLLLTPLRNDSLPKMMQALGRAYVLYFNKRHGRSGTLWEGRYRCALIQTERYFLACMAYIDLNPVRAGMVGQASDYAWSSHGHYIGRHTQTWLTPHPLYWAMGNTPFAREAAYAAMVQSGIDKNQQHALTSSALSGWALGEEEFVKGIQKQTPRRVNPAKAGRPFGKKPSICP
jgi:putative transposase